MGDTLRHVGFLMRYAVKCRRGGSVWCLVAVVNSINKESDCCCGRLAVFVARHAVMGREGVTATIAIRRIMKSTLDRSALAIAPTSLGAIKYHTIT